MTRTIDADALINTLNEKNIPVDVRVNYEIMNAPTIEPDTDTISRSKAIRDISEWATDILHPDRLIKEDAVYILESLPSAETHDIRTETHGVCSDLISRDDAVALVIKAIHGTDNEEIKEYLFDGLRKQMWSLPSAESTGAMDEAIQEYIKDGYMQPIGEDLISRQDAIRKCCGEKCGCEREDCGYTECCSEVSRLERLPSAPDSRKRGEWIYGEHDVAMCDGYRCDRCGFFVPWDYEHKSIDFISDYNFCPNCGARMYKGGEDE